MTHLIWYICYHLGIFLMNDEKHSITCYHHIIDCAMLPYHAYSHIYKRRPWQNKIIILFFLSEPFTHQLLKPAFITSNLHC